MKITYLVSGAKDIEPTHKNIQRAGRRVKHDKKVGEEACDEMRQGGKFIVVAHGDADGTVSWERSDWSESRRWLYVGMKRAPKGIRVYLYSCRVGLKLPRFLKQCVAFAPVDVVPMPVDHWEKIVIGFLKEVEKLLDETAKFDSNRWREHLGKYVNKCLVKEYENPTGDFNFLSLIMLRKALGFPDENS